MASAPAYPSSTPAALTMIPSGPSWRTARRVDDDPERAELANRIAHRAVDVVPATHVGGNERGLPARLGDLLHGFARAVAQQVDDRDGSAAFGESMGDRAPEPRAAAGHDRGASDEPLVRHARNSWKTSTFMKPPGCGDDSMRARANSPAHPACDRR
jgi:hypothetical protein